jgi:hypothetical protein
MLAWSEAYRTEATRFLAHNPLYGMLFVGIIVGAGIILAIMTRDKK